MKRFAALTAIAILGSGVASADPGPIQDKDAAAGRIETVVTLTVCEVLRTQAAVQPEPDEMLTLPPMLTLPSRLLYAIRVGG